MDRRDLLEYHQAFLDLVDAAPVFDYIVDIMGPYILLSMTQAIVRAADPKFPGYTHTDGGESLRVMRLQDSSPPLAMKAMFLLTDVEQENSGNLTVFPGSHLRQIPYRGERAPYPNLGWAGGDEATHKGLSAVTPYSPGAAQTVRPEHCPDRCAGRETPTASNRLSAPSDDIIPEFGAGAL